MRGPCVQFAIHAHFLSIPLAFRRTGRYSPRHGVCTYAHLRAGKRMCTAQSILFDLLGRKSTGSGGAHMCDGKTLYTGISRVIMIRGTHTNITGQCFHQCEPPLGAIAREDVPSRRVEPSCQTLDNGHECK